MTTATFKRPTSPQELQAQLSDEKFLTDLFEAGPSSLGEYIDGYVKSVSDTANRDLSDIQAAVKAELTSTLKDFVRDNQLTPGRPETVAADVKSAGPSPSLSLKLSPVNGGASYNPLALGAKVEPKGTPYTVVDYVRAAYHKNRTLPQAERYMKLEKELLDFQAQAAYTSTVPADGGLLIPETLRSEIMTLGLEKSITRQRATVVTMESPVVRFPTVQDDSHASTVFGGITATWEDETAPGTKSSATFRTTKLEPKKLKAISDVPADLLADAPALQSFIVNAFPSAVSWYEDLAFFEGDGVGKPQGWKNADAAVTVAKESGQAAATIVSKNIFKMFSRLLPESILSGNAVWIANNDTIPQLAELNVAVGTGGNTIWYHSAQQGLPPLLMGLPVIFTEKMETLGTVGDIMLVDLTKYLIGDRQAMQISSSEHESFSNDLITYKVINRVDGRPWISKALTPKKSAATLSPFVKLATRA